MAKLSIGPYECVLTGYAEAVKGPGWSNQVFIIVIQDRTTGRIRLECLQPEEQSHLMIQTFSVLNEMQKIVLHECAKLTSSKQPVQTDEAKWLDKLCPLKGVSHSDKLAWFEAHLKTLEKLAKYQFVHQSYCSTQFDPTNICDCGLAVLTSFERTQ